jgi:hypothetical protein
MAEFLAMIMPRVGCDSAEIKTHHSNIILSNELDCPLTIVELMFRKICYEYLMVLMTHEDF